MVSKMLIDAAHPEETRVAVVSGNRIEEFDFESKARRQLRGNIYLAKVTRVEPSLQAAFVEYGGNRHGFLAFNEIHPDYYQIPVADRERLLKEQAAEDARLDAEPASLTDTKQHENSGETGTPEAEDQDADSAQGHEDDPSSGDEVEDVGSEDALEEASRATKRKAYRSYKIQEVIKRRQVLLVQVVKEERGNKGAALTTYLSLAGRYCVLMPNTARGGGISRKITNVSDRKRLKNAAEDLDVPEGMGLIVRTAGASRTKAEIKRDFEYLLRLWESTRSLTLESSAPCLIYEEGNLIKRSIRDLYHKEIDTVQVEGEASYREAKAFMRMLMPSHAKKVQLHKDTQPLFQKFQVEQQLNAMFSPEVRLKSGGYIVINPTEALVSIDVNSGKATRERNIELTAFKTNLEAAAEVARQLRLRDLAGLVVIDFIDMDENRNNRAVERKLKECLKNDRARIQVSRISPFGLLEMSRQRMRTGVLEGSTSPCPACSGTGIIRDVESKSLHVLREIESETIKGTSSTVTAFVSTQVALYILNQKREKLLGIETRYAVSVFIETDATLNASEHRIEISGRPSLQQSDMETSPASLDKAYSVDDPENKTDAETGPEDNDEENQPKKRRRRRRKRRRGAGEAGSEDSAELQAEEKDEENDTQPPVMDDGGESIDTETPVNAGKTGEEEDDSKPRRRRRRGRRSNQSPPKSTARDDDGNLSAETGEGSVQENRETEPAEVLISYSREDHTKSGTTPEETPASHASAPETTGKQPGDEDKPAPLETPALASTPTHDVQENEVLVVEESSRRRGWWQRR